MTCIVRLLHIAMKSGMKYRRRKKSAKCIEKEDTTGSFSNDEAKRRTKRKGEKTARRKENEEDRTEQTLPITGMRRQHEFNAITHRPTMGSPVVTSGIERMVKRVAIFIADGHSSRTH
jgi:hypothetical protein